MCNISCTSSFYFAFLAWSSSASSPSGEFYYGLPFTPASASDFLASAL